MHKIDTEHNIEAAKMNRNNKGWNNKDNEIKYVIKIYFDLIMNEHVSPYTKSRFSTRQRHVDSTYHLIIIY